MNSSVWLLHSDTPSPTFTAVTSPGELGRWPNEQLHVALESIKAELKRRALASGDLDAQAQIAFTQTGFDAAGWALEPTIVNGMLICTGAKRIKSRASHDCVFVSIDEQWAWNHPDAVYDEMRTLTTGNKTIVQSVTLLPAIPGMEVDVVTSAARSGPCKAKTVTSYTINGDTLTLSGTRSRTISGHR